MPDATSVASGSSRSGHARRKRSESEERVRSIINQMKTTSAGQATADQIEYKKGTDGYNAMSEDESSVNNDGKERGRSSDWPPELAKESEEKGPVKKDSFTLSSNSAFSTRRPSSSKVNQIPEEQQHQVYDEMDYHAAAAAASGAPVDPSSYAQPYYNGAGEGSGHYHAAGEGSGHYHTSDRSMGSIEHMPTTGDPWKDLFPLANAGHTLGNVFTPSSSAHSRSRRSATSRQASQNSRDFATGGTPTTAASTVSRESRKRTTKNGKTIKLEAMFDDDASDFFSVTPSVHSRFSMGSYRSANQSEGSFVSAHSRNSGESGQSSQARSLRSGGASRYSQSSGMRSSGYPPAYPPPPPEYKQANFGPAQYDDENYGAQFPTGPPNGTVYPLSPHAAVPPGYPPHGYPSPHVPDAYGNYPPPTQGYPPEAFAPVPDAYGNYPHPAHAPVSPNGYGPSAYPAMGQAPTDAYMQSPQQQQHEQAQQDRQMDPAAYSSGNPTYDEAYSHENYEIQATESGPVVETDYGNYSNDGSKDKSMVDGGDTTDGSAEPEPIETKGKRGKMFWIIIIIAIILVGAGGGGAAAAMSGGGGGGSGDGGDSGGSGGDSAMTSEEELRARIVELVGNADTLSVPGSPQNNAFLWTMDQTALYNTNIDRLLQRFGLATLYHASGGDKWTNKNGWLSDGTECEWDMITCVGNRLTQINLGNNGLADTIPPEIGLLTTLETMDLSGNTLSSSIPSNVGQMTSMRILRLDDNILTLSIPTQVGSLQNLVVLSVQKNALAASIPTEVGKLLNLQTLDASDNSLVGEIPSEIGNAVSLITLKLSGNSLAGGIPTEVGNLGNLQDLDLTGIPFSSATIPSQIGSMVAMKSFRCDGCFLSGKIPTEVGKLVAIEVWQSSTNTLTGQIPSEFGQAMMLREINLSKNDLNGPLPTEMGLLTNLSSLDVSTNMLNGPIPSELGSISTPQAMFKLTFNGFTGAVPDELCRSRCCTNAVVTVDAGVASCPDCATITC